MKSICFALCGAVFSAAVAADAALAQGGSDAPMFERNRNLSVTERAAQTFAGTQFQQGAFIVSGSVGLGLESDSNVFAQDSGEQSDFAAIVTPRLDVGSTWSRHSLDLFAQTQFREYLDFDNESATTLNLGASGRLDVVRGTFLELDYVFTDGVEPRSTPGPAGIADGPVEFKVDGIELSATREFGRYRLRAAVEADYYDFKDDITPGTGAVLDLDFRDREETVFSVRGDYAVSPDTSLFAGLAINSRDYDLAPPTVVENRNSDGFAAQVGADFDLTALMRGSVAVGYSEQSYDDTAFGEASGLSVAGDVDWFVTRLTTVNFGASRSIEESAVFGSPGMYVTSTDVAVNHELQRNVVVSANLGFDQYDFKGIDRDDDVLRAGVGAQYFFNSNFGIDVSYEYSDRNSSGLDAGAQDYSRSVIGFGFTWRP